MQLNVTLRGRQARQICTYISLGKSVTPESEVVQGGILEAKIVGVPVGKAFLGIAVGDVQLGKKHA